MRNVSAMIMVMAKKSPFVLVYADEVKQHLRAIEVKLPFLNPVGG